MRKLLVGADIRNLQNKARKEDQMPWDTRSLVKFNYNGYTISLVQEESQGNKNLYKVHLEDATSYKRILVHNDEITVYEEYDKSK